MIDMKYLELIHKDIDKTISLNEKKKLDKYLKTNPEAFTLHIELLRTDQLLDKIPDKDPSINLKKMILNSIDYNRYTHTKKRSTVIDFIYSMFSGSRSKIATSFAMGLLAAIAVISVIFYNSHDGSLSEINNIYGTIGITETEVVKSITVNSNNVSGKIEIGKGLNLYRFDIDLNSSKKYKLQVEFDPTNINIDNISLAKLNKIQLDKGPGFVIITGTDNDQYSLFFYTKKLSSEKFIVKIFRDEIKFFEREFVVSNN
jgi:hypothetical protein